MSESNYGSTFSFAASPVLQAQVIGFPELSMGERDTTNHGSGGWQERRPNGLMSAGDFTIKVLSDVQTIADLFVAQKAKTEGQCYLANPVHSYSFAGWIKSIKEDDADAANPDSVTATITVTPIGEIELDDDNPS